MHNIRLLLSQRNVEVAEYSKAFQEILSRSLYCLMIISTARTSPNEGKIPRAIPQGLLRHASYQHYVLEG